MFFEPADVVGDEVVGDPLMKTLPTRCDRPGDGVRVPRLDVGVDRDQPVAIDLPAVTADRTLLSRAFTNLIENALQAMPGGGELRLVVARQENSIRLDVTDTGVGMDEEGVQRAFEPYFSTKTAGSGLGLANARRNIEMCGGTVTLTSAPGNGTTVTVTLPIDRDARGTA